MALTSCLSAKRGVARQLAGAWPGGRAGASVASLYAHAGVHSPLTASSSGLGGGYFLWYWLRTALSRCTGFASSHMSQQPTMERSRDAGAYLAA